MPAVYTFTERLYLTEDNKVVEEGDPAARFLFGVPGKRISLEEAQRYGLASDSDLTAGSVDDVLERVGDDAELAAAVLEAESAKSKPRTTLVAGLEAILEPEEDENVEPANPEPQEEDQHVCPECGRVTKTAVGLRSHISAKHPS